MAYLTDPAILMVSELVTNAILHGGEGALLTLVVADLKLRAEVRDSSPALPVVRSYSDTATTGRGMVIVDALAAAWGSFAVDGGKVVWFELATGDRAPHAPVADEQPSSTGEARRMVYEFTQSPILGGQRGFLWPTNGPLMPVGPIGTRR